MEISKLSVSDDRNESGLQYSVLRNKTEEES